VICGHGGNIYELAQRLGCLPSDIIDMSSNVNPLGPPPGVTEFLKENISAMIALPEADAGKAVCAFANCYGIDPKYVLAGNGTTQFIYAIPKAIDTKKALIVGPTYSDYADACAMHDIAYTYSLTQASQNFMPDLTQIEKDMQAADTVFICHPNNPTGVMIPSDQLESLCRAFPEKTFIIDESYLPFVRNGEKHSFITRSIENVIVLNSMSKIFRVPGLRIGFVAAHETVIAKLVRYALPWSVNSLAQAAVIWLMTNRTKIDAFIEKTRAFLEVERKAFAQRLSSSRHLRLFPSETSFILAELSAPYSASEVCDALSNKGILIRNCSNFKGLSEEFIRVSLKTSEINCIIAERLLAL
jgi:threonine-phosphate decarboxylase